MTKEPSKTGDVDADSANERKQPVRGLTGRRQKVPDRTKSRVTNGSVLLPDMDGRSPEGRRYRDLVHELTDDLGGELNTAEMALVKLGASIILKVEQLSSRIARGADVSEDEVNRLANTAVRVLNNLKTASGKKKATVTSFADRIMGGKANV